MFQIIPQRFVDRPGMLLAGLRRHHPYANVARTIPEQWAAFRALPEIPHSKSPPWYGAICGNDAANNSFEYMCGVEVASFDGIGADLGRMRVPAQSYAVFLHEGHVSLLSATWMRVWNEWQPASDYESAHTPDFELYDERFDPQTGSGVVEVWFAVKRKA